MGYYADLEFEKDMFGYEYDDFVPYYTKKNTGKWSKAVLKQKIGEFVGMPVGVELCTKIGNFAKLKGFNIKESKSQNRHRAKYQFVWTRRNDFKTYLQNGGK